MLELVEGKKQDVWTFRFYQLGTGGRRHYRRIRIGTKAQYPTETDAKRAVDGLRLSVNSGDPQAANPTFGAVIERYLREELPERFSTRVSYKSLLKSGFNRSGENLGLATFVPWKSSIG